MFSRGAFREGAKVQASFRLPAHRYALKLSGTILHIIMGKESYRLGIEYFLDTNMKNSISKYISQRQAEILGEVKTVYKLFYNLKLKESREM